MIVKDVKIGQRFFIEHDGLVKLDEHEDCSFVILEKPLPHRVQFNKDYNVHAATIGPNQHFNRYVGSTLSRYIKDWVQASNFSEIAKLSECTIDTYCMSKPDTFIAEARVLQLKEYIAYRPILPKTIKPHWLCTPVSLSDDVKKVDSKCSCYFIDYDGSINVTIPSYYMYVHPVFWISNEVEISSVTSLLGDFSDDSLIDELESRGYNIRD